METFLFSFTNIIPRFYIRIKIFLSITHEFRESDDNFLCESYKSPLESYDFVIYQLDNEKMVKQKSLQSAETFQQLFMDV